MAGRKSDFTLPKFDDIFSTQEMRDDEKLAKIRDIPLELIDDFPDHPYKVRDDEDMMQLVESIKERGVITPATVRQKEDGRYELISGHRRKRASELAGFETLRCEVVELDRDEATILMVESNLQPSTEQTKPTEEAKPEPEPETQAPEPTEPPKAFDIDYWIGFAKSYAQSKGLVLDTAAVDCWDNPIRAGSHCIYLERDIQSRLNRYANDEDITDVWIWAESVGNDCYDIYIGYA